MYITTQHQLDSAAAKIIRNNIIGIDTEFVRVRTYFPLLSLIQISLPDGSLFAFDMQEKLSFKPLADILKNRLITKIIHSCRQDMEAIKYKMNFVLQNVIDTQIMAKVADYGSQISYAGLVEKFFKVKLDKDSQFSTWGKRPLNEKQIFYALSDVKYLVPLYYAMSDGLGAKKGILNKVSAECERMLDPELYSINMDSQWKKFRNKNRHLKLNALCRAIFIFRERIAISANFLPKMVIDDKVMLNMAWNNNEISYENFKKKYKLSRIIDGLKLYDIIIAHKASFKSIAG